MARPEIPDELYEKVAEEGKENHRTAPNQLTVILKERYEPGIKLTGMTDSYAFGVEEQK